MSYTAHDANDYLGDVASIGGWSAFSKWAKQWAGEQTAELMKNGVSRDPAALAKELSALKATDADVDSVRANLAELAARAQEILILSD